MSIEFWLISIAVFVASFIGTLAGFGTSTILLPVLLLFLPHAQALVITTIIHLFTSLWKVLFFKKGFDVKIFMFFGVPAIVASMIGAYYSFDLSITWFKHIFGLFLLLYSFFIIFNPAFTITPSKKLLVVGGSVTGFSAGFFGMRGVLRSFIFSAYNMPKMVYLAMVGVIALMVDIARLSVYLYQGSTLSYGFFLLFFYIALSFLASYCAQLYVYQISEGLFRKLLAMFLGIMGFLFISGIA